MPNPKSKDAKRKIRRWSFIAKLTKNGETRTFAPPAITIGNSQNARAAAADIKANISSLPQFADASIVVECEGHETVSQYILNQINGLQDQQRLMTLALKAAVTDVVTFEYAEAGMADQLGDEGFDKKVTEQLGKYVIDTQHKLRREDLIARGIDPDAVADEPLSIPEVFSAAQVETEEAA